MSSTTTPDFGSEWIEGFLAPGDKFGAEILTSNVHGVQLGEDMTIVDTAENLAQLGRALVAKFGTPEPEPVVYIAETDTSHFAWHGIGRTPEEAYKALLKAWDQHCVESGADPNYLREWADDFNLIAGPFGTGFRDREQLPRP